MKNEYVTVMRNRAEEFERGERRYKIIPQTPEAKEILEECGGDDNSFEYYYNACRVGKLITEHCISLEVQKLDLDKSIIEEIEPVSKLRNLAAFVSDDLVTVEAVYPGGRRHYTFLATRTLAQTLEEGDNAIVYTQGEHKVVEIVGVHDEVNIDVDAGYNYQPLYCKVNGEHYQFVRSYLDAGEAELKKQQRAALRAQIKGNLDTVLLEDASAEDF